MPCSISRASRPARPRRISRPIDLCRFTAELASTFRSAIDRAGLSLRIDCPPLPAPAYVDRDMWEKVVLNLLSNALKFTFDGEIAIKIRPTADGKAVEVCGARHRHRHPGGRAAAPVRALPSRRGRARPKHRGQRHRPGAGAGAGPAAWRRRSPSTSEVGSGSTFTVRLPFGTDASARRPRQAEPRAAHRPACGRRPMCRR